MDLAGHDLLGFPPVSRTTSTFEELMCLEVAVCFQTNFIEVTHVCVRGWEVTM